MIDADHRRRRRRDRRSNAPDKLNALDAQALARAASGVRRRRGRRRARAAAARRGPRVLRRPRHRGVDPATDDVPRLPRRARTPLLRRMAAFPAPTFAAAQGAVPRRRAGLLIATDVVYVADTAKIGSPFANLGATLDSGGHALFFERLGAHRRST